MDIILPSRLCSVPSALRASMAAAAAASIFCFLGVGEAAVDEASTLFTAFGNSLYAFFRSSLGRSSLWEGVDGSDWLSPLAASFSGFLLPPPLSMLLMDSIELSLTIGASEGGLFSGVGASLKSSFSPLSVLYLLLLALLPFDDDEECLSSLRLSRSRSRSLSLLYFLSSSRWWCFLCRSWSRSLSRWPCFDFFDGVDEAEGAFSFALPSVAGFVDGFGFLGVVAAATSGSPSSVDGRLSFLGVAVSASLRSSETRSSFVEFSFSLPDPVSALDCRTEDAESCCWSVCGWA